ncbi:Uncharacterised protein [Segatella copri]|nr:Uncharacterised protein [Segatella copri]
MMPAMSTLTTSSERSDFMRCAVDLLAQVVHARTEYGSFHLYGVGVAWQDAVYAD